MQELFEVSVLCYREEIYRYILKRVYSEDLAQELLQTTFMNAWKNFEMLKNPESTKSWLYKIASNCIASHWRDKAKTVSAVSNIVETEQEPVDIFDLIAGEADILEDLIERFDGRMAVYAMSKLRDEERLLIHMRYIEELSLRQMVQIMGMKEKTLSSKLSRALQKYRKVYFALEKGEGGKLDE